MEPGLVERARSRWARAPWLIAEGRSAEAAALAEAADACRRLAAADDAFLADLALTTHGLGLLHADAADWPRAAPAMRESVDGYRRLAQADPATHGTNLAVSLSILSVVQARLGQAPDANVCLVLRDLDRLDEALAAARDAIRDPRAAGRGQPVVRAPPRHLADQPGHDPGASGPAEAGPRGRPGEPGRPPAAGRDGSGRRGAGRRDGVAGARHDRAVGQPASRARRNAPRPRSIS